MHLLFFLSVCGVALSQTNNDLTKCPGSVPRNNYLKVYDGKCLQFVLTERSWTQASADCQSRGGNLVMIKDAGKQAFVYNTLKSLHWRYNGVWIGGSDRDKEGTWVWVDGTPMSFGNWHQGQGATAHHGLIFSSSFEDCAEMRLDDGGRWYDYSCSGQNYPYICEYAKPSPDLANCPGSVPRNNYLKVYSDKCLQFVLTERSWTNASADCQSRGGNLVMIKNAGKQDFVYNTLKSFPLPSNGTWIGGSDRDKEGSWVWVDGTPMSFGNWHQGRGATAHHGFFFFSSFEDCAEMRLDDGGRWYDYSCSGQNYPYICEYAKPSPDLANCPGSVPHNNYLKVYSDKCLQFVLTERSWTNASADCQSRGGNLVMIKNAGKQDFVYNTLKSFPLHSNGTWIGGSDKDKEGSWVWVDGSPMSFGNWHPGRGATAHSGFFFSSLSFEDCAEMRLDDRGMWRDYTCTTSCSYICEYEKHNRPSTHPPTTEEQMPTTTSTLSRSTAVISSTIATSSTTTQKSCSSFQPPATLVKNYGNSCLRFVKYDKSWNDANDECVRQGGRLLQIHDQMEQDFVFESLRSLHWSDSGAWIGATDRGSEGLWTWTDESSVEYSHWKSGEGPSHNATNENCAMINVDDGMWYDYDCGSVIYNQAYICQYSLQ